MPYTACCAKHVHRCARPSSKAKVQRHCGAARARAHLRKEPCAVLGQNESWRTAVQASGGIAAECYVVLYGPLWLVQCPLDRSAPQLIFAQHYFVLPPFALAGEPVRLGGTAPRRWRSRLYVAA